MMNNENGRSMVEMLGVLAIIGVLSVAGIAGYTMAMNKYRANEIINAASQAAVLAEAAAATATTDQTRSAADAGYTGTIGGLTPANITATVTTAGVKSISIKGCASTTEPCKTANTALGGTSPKIGEFSVTFSAS